MTTESVPLAKSFVSLVLCVALCASAARSLSVFKSVSRSLRRLHWDNGRPRPLPVR